MKVALAKRILFIDPLLPTQPDYLSMAVYIGLVETLGAKIDVLFKAPYLYIAAGCREASLSLYGRGFSYACTLPLSARQPPLDPLTVTANIRSRAYDVVVFGAGSAALISSKRPLRPMLAAHSACGCATARTISTTSGTSATTIAHSSSSASSIRTLSKASSLLAKLRNFEKKNQFRRNFFSFAVLNAMLPIQFDFSRCISLD
jgi:hypothetical protein